MRQAIITTSVLLLLTATLLSGCGGGTKSGNGGVPLTRTDEGTLTNGGFLRQELADNVTALKMNAVGDILATRKVGTSPGGDLFRIYHWKNGVWKDISPSGAEVVGGYNLVMSLNNQGQALFLAASKEDPDTKKFMVYSNGVSTELRANDPNIRIEQAVGIADDGTVMGVCVKRITEGPDAAPNAYTWHLFRWRNGEVTTTAHTGIKDTNLLGQMLVSLPGKSPVDGWFGLEYPDGTIVPLTDLTPNTYFFSFFFFGDDGSMVGQAYDTKEERGYHAILREGAVDRLLPTTDLSELLDMNRHHDVVGKDPNGPFLHRSKGPMINLSESFPESDRAKHLTALQIDDQGRIAALYGTKLFLLTPVAR